MKKMLFLMLFLLILGAANVNSQVRIGGNGQPNPAAVLDLNADNTVTGTKGLALPRVSLTDINTALTGSPTVNGMLVYNTNTTLGAGVYYWDTNQWIKVSDGSFVEGDGIVGNEFSDTISGGGLTKSGAGTAGNPLKVGIKAGGVTSDKIANMAVTLDKIYTQPSDSGKILWTNGRQWQLKAYSTKVVDSLKANVIGSPPIVTWSLILNEMINISQGGGEISVVVVNGLNAYDLCDFKSGSRMLTSIHRDNMIYIMNNEAGSAVGHVVIRCFRPSL